MKRVVLIALILIAGCHKATNPVPQATATAPAKPILATPPNCPTGYIKERIMEKPPGNVIIHFGSNRATVEFVQNGKEMLMVCKRYYTPNPQ